MKLVSSRDNPLFRKLHRLAADARESRKQGRTLIDGPHLVADYRQHIGLPELLLVSETGASRAEVRELIDLHADAEVVLLKDGLFKALCGVESPVGIAAVVAIPEPPADEPAGDCVLLDAIQDAGNLGSILRSAAAAGVRDALLGSGCVAAWSPRVLRAAQGAHFRLRIREAVDLAEFLGGYRGCALATVVSGGQSIYEAVPSGAKAWMFGNEGRGINPALMAMASCKVTIPMAAETESLNVAAAAAICLFVTAKANYVHGGT